MSEQNLSEQEEKVPYLQRLFDRPFVLLILGLVIMFGFYTVWGMMEIISLPQAKLP